jgi:hypothetical protein
MPKHVGSLPLSTPELQLGDFCMLVRRRLVVCAATPPAPLGAPARAPPAPGQGLDVGTAGLITISRSGDATCGR